MVAEEEVLTVLRAILSPILAGYLNGGSLGVLVVGIFYVVGRQKIKYGLTAEEVIVAHIPEI
jgi:hypothetical protein